jgi:hypothetical protein
MQNDDAQPANPVHDLVHTPGPWRFEHYSDLYHDIYGADGSLIVDDCGVIGQANARLIAAAPDLLAACLAFMEADNQCGANLAFVMAQEAIRKVGISPKENGGETCDMKHGPCACGATH